ncbi:MAG: ubiquinol-cytochrome c reductase iron-sulfur subunit [Acidobacteria bacterium]|jgi:Rieske Fe-S protein|nr:ubiquinol-cytochrome c reductase iron-sulfur subunit [Acidobacteriota bacterium]
MEHAESHGRRRLLNWFLGTSAGALCASLVYPVVRYLSPPTVPETTTAQVEAGSTMDPDLVEKGFKILRFGAEPVILIRVSETDFRAFSATCTHLSCIVEFRKARQLIWCNCHNGVYDLNGRNIEGPPPRPLTPFEVHLVSGGPGQPEKLVVSRKA